MPTAFSRAPPLLTRRDAIAPRQTAAAVLCSTPQLHPIIPLTLAPRRAWERPRGQHNPKGHRPRHSWDRAGLADIPGGCGQGATRLMLLCLHPTRRSGHKSEVPFLPSGLCHLSQVPLRHSHQCTKSDQPPTSTICAQICDIGGADPRCPLPLSKLARQQQYYPCKREDVETNFFFPAFFFFQTCVTLEQLPAESLPCWKTLGCSSTARSCGRAGC